MKTTTSERLKQLMHERGLKQTDILRLAEPHFKSAGTKLNKNDLSQYVSGKVTPGQFKLSLLSLALDVPEVWLMGYDVPKTRLSEESFGIMPITVKNIPLLGEISCGEPVFASEDRQSYVAAGVNVKADFCLKAKGDSMINARIYDGDIVFIEKCDVVENGTVAAVIIGDDALLKRVFFYPEQGKLLLVAENTKYPPLVYMGDELNEVKILGRAIAFQSDVR
ncbi:MAG: repressor LexA [Clostridia bacterium]|nr:repressor LexA [Clostridia bacterium]